MADGPDPHIPGPVPIVPRKEAPGGQLEPKFVCEHCGEETLSVIAVSDSDIKAECLSCGKESTFARDAVQMLAFKPPAQRP